MLGVCESSNRALLCEGSRVCFFGMLALWFQDTLVKLQVGWSLRKDASASEQQPLPAWQCLHVCSIFGGEVEHVHPVGAAGAIHALQGLLLPVVYPVVKA